MKFFETMSLNTKLTALIMAVAFFALIMGFAVITVLDARNFREDLVEESILNSKITAEYCIGDLAFGYKDEASQALEKLSLIRNIDHAVIYDIHGNIFATYARDGKKLNCKSPENPTSLKEPYTKFINEELVIYEPMTYKGKFYGTLHIGVSTSQLTKKIWNRVKLIILLAFCIAIIIFLLTTRVQRLISQPILQLAEMTRTIASRQDYSIRSILKRGDEIGILSDGFNSMIKKQ